MSDAVNYKRHARRYLRAARRIGPLAAADALILFLAFSLLYSVRTGSFFFHTTYTLRFVVFAIITTAIALYFTGSYKRIWTRTSGHEVSIILNGTLLALSTVLVVNLIAQPRPLPVSVLLVTYLVALSGFVGIRYRSRVISGMEWRWRAVWHHEFPPPDTRTLIVGAGEAGQITAWRLKHRFLNGRSGHRVVGYVDDDPDKQGLFVEGAPVLGTCGAIPTIAQTQKIDLIVFAIHNVSGARFREILSLCEHTQARIKIVPDVFNLLNNDEQAPVLRDVEAEDLLGRQPISWYDEVDASPITGKVVLITGAAGSIGAELCRQMLNYHPVRLILLDNNESGLNDLYVDLKIQHPDRDIVAVLADITHPARLDAIFARYKPQLVYHAAAYKHVPLLEDYPQEAIRVNVGGTLNVAQVAQKHRAERFVLISTDKAVNPSSVMGASKRVCELLTQALSALPENRTVFAAVRFGNVLGSRGSVVPIFTRQIEAGGPVTVTDPHMVRFFMSIPEAVNLVIQAACLTEGDDLFMLRMGDPVPIVELAERMIRLRGLRPQIDIPITFTGVRPGEKLTEELHTNTEKTYATIHPDIVRLNGTICEWQPHAFVAQAREIIDLGLDVNGTALHRLTQLAESVRCAETHTADRVVVLE